MFQEECFQHSLGFARRLRYSGNCIQKPTHVYYLLSMHLHHWRSDLNIIQRTLRITKQCLSLSDFLPFMCAPLSAKSRISWLSSLYSHDVLPFATYTFLWLHCSTLQDFLTNSSALCKHGKRSIVYPLRKLAFDVAGGSMN